VSDDEIDDSARYGGDKTTYQSHDKKDICNLTGRLVNDISTTYVNKCGSHCNYDKHRQHISLLNSH
jgi:hypothetical protein